MVRYDSEIDLSASIIAHSLILHFFRGPSALDFERSSPEPAAMAALAPLPAALGLRPRAGFGRSARSARARGVQLAADFRGPPGCPGVPAL